MRRSKCIMLLLTALAVLGIAGCNNQTDDNGDMQSLSVTSSGSTTESAPREKRRVIIDTDTGADDAAALILAAKDEYTEIVGVTVLVGNVDLEKSADNALMALETAGADVPVYKGADQSINGEKTDAYSVFGTDGMGDADLIHPKGRPQEGDAVDFMINTVNENPGEIEIIAIGPATNVANAILKDPEAMKQVKMIWSMGTAGRGPGNVSPVAEFNVYADADAYKIMLDSGLPITVVGLDVCGGDALWSQEQFDRLDQTNDTGRFVSASYGKIREFYSQDGSDGVMNCDPLAMMCALYPDFINATINCHGSCITEKGETFSQVIFYEEGITYDTAQNDFKYNVRLVTDVKSSEYFERYIEAIRY